MRTRSSGRPTATARRPVPVLFQQHSSPTPEPPGHHVRPPAQNGPLRPSNGARPPATTQATPRLPYPRHSPRPSLSKRWFLDYTGVGNKKSWAISTSFPAFTIPVDKFVAHGCHASSTAPWSPQPRRCQRRQEAGVPPREMRWSIALHHSFGGFETALENLSEPRQKFLLHSAVMFTFLSLPSLSQNQYQSCSSFLLSRQPRRDEICKFLI